MAKPTTLPARTYSLTTSFHYFQPYEGNRVRSLRYDVNALADFEQETGMGFALLMKQKAMFGTVRAMLWAGLKHEDRTLTIERIGELITQYLRDKSIPRDQRDINVLLEAAFVAAVEQEAFGDFTNLEKEKEEKEQAIDAQPSTDANPPETPDVPVQ